MSILFAVAIFVAALGIQRSICKMLREDTVRFEVAAAEYVSARSHIYEHSR